MIVAETSVRSDAHSLFLIQNDLESNFFIEAGAGTGKTHSLVQRIMALLEGGVGIDEIIAITFTRAAASELRSRIRSELETLRAENPNDTWIASALENIDTAAFQTIDAFVYSILREYPMDAGLPPAIDVQTAFDQLQEFRERWRQWVIESLELDSGLARAISSAMRLDLKSPFQRLSELANSINAQHGETKNRRIAPTERRCIAIIYDLKWRIDELELEMGWCSDQEDKLYSQMRVAVDWYRGTIEGREVAGDTDAENLLMSWPKVRSGNGQSANWGDAATLARARASLKSVIESINEGLAAARTTVTLELFDFVSDFVDEIIEERHRSGTVSYYDAITWLNEMLRGRDDIRLSVQQRFRRVLVDEFQDTAPNQVELVRLLTIPPGENRIAPGRLFVVGDPKQSIYRFRGAQVDISQGVKKDVTDDNGGGQLVTLTENRRSTRAIIRWVNQVFGNWMPNEQGQADWISLDMATETAVPDNFGGVFHFGEEKDTGNINEIREYDAKEVAKIARAVCSGALTVRDRSDGNLRDSRPGDLAILTRARSSWEIYTRELDNLKLPYAAEIGGAAVLQTQEFRDILNCLTALDDPSDQPATVGALKSPYFGCTDVDLYQWASAGGRFICTSEFPEEQASDTVRDAMIILRRYHGLRDELQPPVLIERFIRERQARELTYLSSDPAPGLRRLDLAVELARRFTEDGATSLRECLIRFSQFREADQAIREEPSYEFDQGKIRFMTIHSSKGLEFPIVILADLCRRPPNDNPKLLVDRGIDRSQAEGIGIRLGGSKASGYFQTSNFEELVKRDKAAERLEHTRLHYVASTRARDYLFVSRYRKMSDRTSAAALIEKHAGDDASLWAPIPNSWAGLEYFETSRATQSVAPYTVVDRDEWMLNHRRLLESASRRNWLTPSDLKSPNTTEDYVSGDEKPDFNNFEEAEEFPGRGRAATQIGRAVHAAVQRALESRDADIPSIARNEAELHGVGGNADEIARLASATLEMPLIKRVAAMSSENVWIETPVAVPHRTSEGDSTVIDGRVDLIYRLPDGTLGIADFKTDRTFDRSVHEMAQPYIPQLGAYAYAVSQATGIPVSEATILFSRLASDKQGDGEYKLSDISAAIDLALKLASNQ